MLQIHTDRVGDVAVVQCEGRLVRSDAAFRLRDEVISQVDARAIVLDLSEVNALEGGGLRPPFNRPPSPPPSRRLPIFRSRREESSPDTRAYGARAAWRLEGHQGKVGTGEEGVNAGRSTSGRGARAWRA